MATGKKQAPVDQFEMDLLAEQELSRLQRQYRIMEGDRLDFSEEGGAKLRKQRKVINILKNEQNNLMTDLKVATSDSKKKQDTVLMQTLHNLLTEHGHCASDIKKETNHLKEVEFQIRKIEKDVFELRSKQVTDVQQQARVMAAQRQVAQLENRLEVAVKKFNTVLTENQDLRGEIDHLLKERAHFNLLWERLINNLNQGKKFMLDLIEQATLAYDQREEWCSKLQALRQRGHSDLLLHTQEMRDLQRKLDHDAKLQEFLGTKGQKRIMADLHDKETRKRDQARQAMEKQLEQYRQMLEQIREFWGESDIEKLAATYVKQEEENFAIFNYVNELNHEMEALSDSIRGLRYNIEDQRSLNQSRAKQQVDTIASLKQKLKQATSEADAAEKELTGRDNQLGNILMGVEKIFKLLKCSNSPLLNLLGDKVTVTTYNAVMYVGLIEKRMTDIIHALYYKERSTAEKTKKKTVGLIKGDPRTRHIINTLEQITPTQPCALCVEQELVSDVIDTLQISIDREEAKRRFLARMELPNALDRLHNVSACHLPRSRQIMQRRYQ